ncbi:glycosyltransferase family 4 protein [Salinigranum halophilum]|uniref:glycosyltransferase family 4 protein n=1 Tax=Salinigranum halophilum TaxID=2565931 RepID=UPI0010A8DEA2|nr:glycosyltransferase family 4 protein [Salinigranum halophilum]
MFPPAVGGSEVYAYELANTLGRLGHDVDVITQSVPGAERTIPLNENVTIRRITRARKYLVTFETLYFSLRARLGVDLDDYDVIHGTLMPASTIALSDKLTFETPIVVTSHGTSLGETRSHTAELPSDYLLKYFFHPTNIAFDAIAGNAADHVIAISQHTKDQLVNTYTFSQQKVSLIPHGVDTSRFYPREQHHRSVSSDKLSLLFVGRLASRKGVSQAIDCISLLPDELDVELLIAGTGRHKTRLEELAASYGVVDRIQFLGYVPDEELPILYSSADVFLFPSRYEGFGLVFLEAMACGTPVIGTPVGGIPDIVVNEQSGFVVGHDPSEMAEKVEYLARNSEVLERMSDFACETAGSKDWSTVAERVEAVYHQLL